jgi:hypothetical protein
MRRTPSPHAILALRIPLSTLLDSAEAADLASGAQGIPTEGEIFEAPSVADGSRALQYGGLSHIPTPQRARLSKRTAAITTPSRASVQIYVSSNT